MKEMNNMPNTTGCRLRINKKLYTEEDCKYWKKSYSAFLLKKLF